MASDLKRNTEIIAANLHDMADMLHGQVTPHGRRYVWAVGSDGQLKVSDNFSGLEAVWPQDFAPEFQDSMKKGLFAMARS